MTKRHKSLTDTSTLRVVAAGALIVASACAAPILATETRADVGGEAAPLRCGVATDSLGGMTTFRPWVRLDRALPASYHFALTGGGTVVDQSGSIEVGADGQVLLGEATVTGPASGYDVELTVTVGGTRYRCHGDEIDI